MNTIVRSLGIVSLLVIGFASCKKEDAVTIPPEQAHFTGLKSGTYFITSPTANYKVPVGLTTVNSSDRVVNYHVYSPTLTGADYTLTTNTATAGQVKFGSGRVLDSITVKVTHPENYTAITKRRDTLYFVIENNKGGGATPSSYNDTFRLVIRPACLVEDMDSDIEDLEGTYANTIEDFGGAYGPYTTRVKDITFTPGSRSATMTVENLWDNGWADIQFTLDWNNPAAPTTTVIQNNNAGPGATISSTYAAYRVSIKQHASAPTGTFDFCNQTITLKAQLGYWNPTTNSAVGYYGTIYTVVLKH